MDFFTITATCHFGKIQTYKTVFVGATYELKIIWLLILLELIEIICASNMLVVIIN